ncbi:MAG: hypothetical protein ACM3S1_04990, partial [Hyphomicrobiales bacterium]
MDEPVQAETVEETWDPEEWDEERNAEAVAVAATADAGDTEPEGDEEPERTLDDPPGPVGRMRGIIFVTLTLAGTLLAGSAGAYFIGEEHDNADAGGTVEAVATATATPTATAVPPTST